MAQELITLQLQDVTTGYRVRGKKISIGKNYNSILPAGKLTSLLGINGSGKSTLLRSLSKSQNILSGKISIGERDINSIPNTEIGKLVGIVLTDRIDTPNMSVYELIALGRAPYSNFWGNLKTEDKRIVEEAMQCIAISNLRERKVCSLSDGERQKVMVAKALAQETPIILLDEPTAFLDYPSKLELMLLMRKLAAENKKTILLSTHDLPVALQLSDYIWLVDENRNLITGTPDELIESGMIGNTFNREGINYDYGAIRRSN